MDLQGYLVENYRLLHRRLTRYLGCPELASDSLHDAWLRLGDKGPMQSVRCPDAYVYRVACNLAADQLRSRRIRQYTNDAELEFLADHSPGPDLIAEARADLEALTQAMNGLPSRHQDILVCLRVDELTRQEVAIRHGISLRRVDTMLRQALDFCVAQTKSPVLAA